MPVQRCQMEGRKGWKWGPNGVCFLGPDARDRAAAVGRAIAARERDADRRDQDAPRLSPPDAVEDEYRQLMAGRIADLHGRIVRAITARIPGTGIVESGRRTDGRAEDAAALVSAVRAVQRTWVREKPIARLTRQVEDVATDVDGFTTRRIADVVESVAPIDVSGLRAEAGGMTADHVAWARDNVSLIGGLEDLHFDQVAEWVTQAVEGGASAEKLAKTLEERLGISRRRAKNVARDQIGTLNSQITKRRHEELEISRFEWTTVGDERVREEHAAIDGQVFDWATGHPTEGFPGQPINCRCVAIPVV